jgi:glycosyltransferase involved in cell wall biosynthesis
MKDLYVIVNERIFNKKNFFFCENKDIQSITNYLALRYRIFLIARYSYFEKPFKLKKIYKVFNFNFRKIFIFLSLLFNLDKKKKKLLIISITPFNFIIFVLFKIFFDCKFYLFLRSNGQEEYKSILGKKYVFIYDFMFLCMTRYSVVISCQKRLYNKKCHILHPSELTENWRKKIKRNYFRKEAINILYVGRFKIEKGIYSLLEIFSQLPENIKLTLVGSGDVIQIKNKRIKIVNFINKESELINIYDSSNIIILPSYTEAYPKVVDEALSRHRPVIIFKDISYIIGNRKGIFIAQRNQTSLKEIILYVKKNYKKISKEMKTNILPTKNNFLIELQKIIN